VVNIGETLYASSHLSRWKFLVMALDEPGTLAVGALRSETFQVFLGLMSYRALL